MKVDGRPENMEPARREAIIKAYSRRKTVRYILHGIAFVSLILFFMSHRYNENLTGLSLDAERWIFIGVFAFFLIVSFFYWRCPHCKWLFKWRMDPKTCWNCGAQLVKPPPKPDEKGEVDFRVYIRMTKLNRIKYFLYFILILVIDIGFLVLCIYYLAQAVCIEWFQLNYQFGLALLE